MKKITNCLKVAFLRPTEPLVDNYKAAEPEDGKEGKNEDKTEPEEGKEDKNEDKLELRGTSDEADAVRNPRSLNKRQMTTFSSSCNFCKRQGGVFLILLISKVTYSPV